MANKTPLVFNSGGYPEELQSGDNLVLNIVYFQNSASPDTNLYRSEANVLKTDDKFNAALGYSVGNANGINASVSITDRKKTVHNFTFVKGILTAYSTS